MIKTTDFRLSDREREKIAETLSIEKQQFHSSLHQSLHYHYQVRRVGVRQFTMCEPTPLEGGRFNIN